MPTINLLAENFHGGTYFFVISVGFDEGLYVSAMGSRLVDGLTVLYRAHWVDDEAFDVMAQKAVEAL